jgi:hypothetical protein
MLNPIQVLVSMPIQMFFAYRIGSLTKSFWLPLVICIFALASFGACNVGFLNIKLPNKSNSRWRVDCGKHYLTAGSRAKEEIRR